MNDMPAQEPQIEVQPTHHLRHIRELDGIRGIAALMVFFHHICYASIPDTNWPAPIVILRSISISGRYGVDLFFVLSGFLITSLLIGARQETYYYSDFYWKRALRILPLYLLCLLALLIFVPGSVSYVLLSAFFLANFSGIFHIGASGPFWTLAIEEQFYLIWPTVVRLRSVAQLRRWAISIVLMAFTLRLIAAAAGHANYIFTFFHCDGLAFGAFLACWYLERDARTADLRLEDRAAALGLALAIIMIALPTLGSGLKAFCFHQALVQSGVTLLCGSVTAFAMAHSGQRSLSILRSRLLTFLGLISYAIYMTHAYVAVVYDRLRGPLISGDVSAYALRFFAILGVTIALCLALRYLVELPAMSLRRFVLAKPSVPSPGDPPLPLENL